MPRDASDVAWDMLVELRKELVESQKIRAQIIGFKITFVSGGIGVAAAQIDRVPGYVLLLPAFAAVFFDILITSYSYSIKRTGYYIGAHLEPIVANSVNWPLDVPLWERFMFTERAGKNTAYLGNLGITLIASVVGIVGLFLDSEFELPNAWQTVILALLLLLLACDFWLERQPWKAFYDHGSYPGK